MATKTRVSVKVRNGNFEGALKAFKSKVYHSGILQEYMDNQYYTKPSEKRYQEKKDKIFKSKLNNKLKP